MLGGGGRGRKLEAADENGEYSIASQSFWSHLRHLEGVTGSSLPSFGKVRKEGRALRIRKRGGYGKEQRYVSIGCCRKMLSVDCELQNDRSGIIFWGLDPR